MTRYGEKFGNFASPQPRFQSRAQIVDAKGMSGHQLTAPFTHKETMPGDLPLSGNLALHQQINRQQGAVVPPLHPFKAATPQPFLCTGGAFRHYSQSFHGSSGFINGVSVAVHELREPIMAPDPFSPYTVQPLRLVYFFPEICEHHSHTTNFPPARLHIAPFEPRAIPMAGQRVKWNVDDRFRLDGLVSLA